MRPDPTNALAEAMIAGLCALHAPDATLAALFRVPGVADAILETGRGMGPAGPSVLLGGRGGLGPLGSAEYLGGAAHGALPRDFGAVTHSSTPRDDSAGPFIPRPRLGDPSLHSPHLQGAVGAMVRGAVLLDPWSTIKP